MDLLRERRSSKKYLPHLYVHRRNFEQRLRDIIAKGDRSVILVTAMPQLGKTCFVCNCTEQLLAESIPCLFFPAVQLSAGLLSCRYS